jgi:hypothetical protein
MMDERFEALYELLPRKPECWTMMDVIAWLKLINMDKYLDKFSKNLSLCRGE